MKQDVLNIKGKSTGREIVLNKSIFQIQPNEHAVYLDVKQYLAHQRTGTHKSKERSEIKGSTRKIKRQKGTGTARAGSIKNPIFRGGGRTFGPRVRSYTQKVNKTVKKLGVSAITITHDISSINNLASRVILLDHNKIAWSGIPNDMNKSKNSIVMQFLINK